MSTSSRKRNLVSFVFALLLAPSLVAQAPSPNADILKMIQAGLPEDVIVDKITAGTGHWDVSVDALIALKSAGATPAEMKAMTAPLATVQPSAAATHAAPIIVAGGTLLRTKEGDPFIQFPQRVPTVFPDFEPSNIVRLISYDGKPAIRVPAEHMSGDLGPSAGNTSGNLIITHDVVLFDPYLREDGWGFYPKNGKYVLDDKKIKSAQEEAFSIPRSAINLQYISLREHVSGNPMPSDRATTFGKKNRHYDMGGYEVGFHYTGVNRNHDINEQVPCKVTADCASPELEAFVRDLVHNFDETIATVLSAAGITDADKQLSANAHYHLITPADFSQYAATYQAQLDHTAPPVANAGGGFWGGLSTVLQVAGAGATALQQGNDGGNTAAAQLAARQQYDQNVASIMNGGTAAPYVAPTSAAPAATPQDVLNHQLATIKAAAPPTAGAAGSSTPKNFTYNENLPNGDIRKSTTTGVQGAYTITIQCFTHNGSAPYFTYSRNGPSDFFFNLPPCSGSPTVASAPAPPPPSNTVAPPVPYQKPPSTGGTVVASGNVCPASGYTFTSYGDAATGVPCTPGQPIAGSTGSGSGSGGSAGSSSGSSAGSGIKTTPALTNCLAQSYVDGDLTVTNTCNVPVYASWWINGHGGSWTLNPGEHTGTGYSSSDVAVGGASYYVCPKNASPVDSSGNALTGPVSSYVCVVRY